MHIDPPKNLQAIEYLEEMQSKVGGGASDPKLIFATDDEEEDITVVLKLRDPGAGSHFGSTSLACELVCSMLGRAIGLSVPDYFSVNLSQDFISSVTDTEVQSLFAQNEGLNFGTRYHPRWSTYEPRQDANSGIKSRLADTICFDSSIRNDDRTWGNSNLMHKGGEVLLIDHSVAFPFLRENLEFPYFQDSDVRRHCSYQALCQASVSYERPHDEWKASIGKDELRQMRDMIPSSWEESSGDLEEIFDFLSNQPSNFANLLQPIRRVLS